MLDMDAAKLSQNDSAVLSALFDPESSLSSTIQVEDSDHHGQDSDLDRIQRVQQRERQALHLINHETPTTTDINHSITQLTAIINDEPTYASAWNNRAQARRMLLGDEDLPKNPSRVADILQDLGQAISLTTPSQINGTISSIDARVLSSAHTHRGYLLLVASKSKESRSMLDEVPGLKAMSAADLEEAASRELGLGGRYGNETARQLAVKTNPYAKLCGSIVRDALTKEIADFYRPCISVAK